MRRTEFDGSLQNGTQLGEQIDAALVRGFTHLRVDYNPQLRNGCCQRELTYRVLGMAA